MDGRGSLRSCFQERGGNRVGGGPAHSVSGEATTLEGAGGWKSFLIACVTLRAMGPRSGEQPLASPIKRVAAENGTFNPQEARSLGQEFLLLCALLHLQYLD